jgi:hypothetical protein
MLLASSTTPGEDDIDWRFVEAERREGWDAEYVRACRTFVDRRGIVIHESGTAAPLSKGSIFSISTVSDFYIMHLFVLPVTYEKLYSFALKQGIIRNVSAQKYICVLNNTIRLQSSKTCPRSS